ncbi:unnamed protein product [Phyllotreta striolata]|uniref:Uncharacterized protein n=1 Tax=Phyllotreta striolata TaxID=444603 RepID=A0A9P0GQR4_PHYSR|nr:unnamed protein product [Phyllotreta striolata]
MLMLMHTVFLFFLIFVNPVENHEDSSMFDKIKSGFKMAGEFFSTDHASKVANLVSNALGRKPNRDKNEENSNIFSGFMRLFGFESRQITAIAINTIILIAKLIGSSLNSPLKQKSPQIEEDKPFEWMLKSAGVSHIIPDTENMNLSEHVIDYITERSLDEETGCIQLLICKIKPFIREMQRALKERGRSAAKGFNLLFEYFPNSSTIIDNGYKCEKKYYYCSVPL